MSVTSTLIRRVMRLADIEASTGIPIETLRWLRKRGEGPPTFVLAGRVVAYEDDVAAWVERAAAQRRSAS
jgi:hypothetical protein